MTHITVITFTLLTYLFLGAAYYGWGRVAALLLGIAHQRSESSIMPIWLGWAFALLIFQVLHFFLPITVYVSLPVLAFGAVFSISQIRNEVRRFPTQRFALILLMVAVILALGLAAWVASRAMLPPTDYDSGLYHFNAIRWINAYPVVPGLGNLHGRLAFNSSFFTYVAALNFYPFFGHGRSLANSFLFLLVLATILPSMVSIIRRPSLLVKEHPFRYASDLFMLPTVAYIALSSTGFASPSPDLASILLQLVMFVMLAHGIAEWKDGYRDQNYRVMVLIVLAATAVTVKLSNLAFSLVIIGFALTYTWQTSRPHLKGVVRILLPVTMLILVWGLRGVILSGAPFYPSTIGYMPVEWAVPIEKIVVEANLIYGWARLPGIQWIDTLNSWMWLRPWFLRVYNDNMIGVVYPLILTVLFCIITIVIGCFKKVRRPHYLEWSFLLPSLIGLIYWFFTAPDPRFANAIFFLALICSMLLFLLSMQEIMRAWMFIITLGIVFLVGNVYFIRYVFYNRGLIKLVSTSGWHAVKEVPLYRMVIPSGLTVYVPKGPQCWDSPLPSTPCYNKGPLAPCSNDQGLRLRNPMSMSSGFTVKRDKSMKMMPYKAL